MLCLLFFLFRKKNLNKRWRIKANLFSTTVISAIFKTKRKEKRLKKQKTNPSSLRTSNAYWYQMYTLMWWIYRLSYRLMGMSVCMCACMCACVEGQGLLNVGSSQSGGLWKHSNTRPQEKHMHLLPLWHHKPQTVYKKRTQQKTSSHLFYKVTSS